MKVTLCFAGARVYAHAHDMCVWACVLTYVHVNVRLLKSHKAPTVKIPS